MGKGKGRELTLEELGIYFAGPFAVEDCPKELQDLFQLVNDVQDLRITKFGGLHAANEANVEVRIKAAHEYDKALKRQAMELATACFDPDRADDTETKWVSILDPLVFLRLDREKEEKATYHYW